MYYGPNYDDATKDAWEQTSAGWWILWDGARPEHFARLRTMKGMGVEGAQDGHRWLIPQLLQWDPESILVCAVDEIYRQGTWEPPVHLVPILEGLRAIAMAKVQPIRTVTDPEALELGMAVIALNYHISIVEMDLGGWMSSGFLTRTLCAAAGEQALLAALKDMESEVGR